MSSGHAKTSHDVGIGRGNEAGGNAVVESWVVRSLYSASMFRSEGIAFSALLVAALVSLGSTVSTGRDNRMKIHLCMTSSSPLMDGFLVGHGLERQ